MTSLEFTSLLGLRDHRPSLLAVLERPVRKMSISAKKATKEVAPGYRRMSEGINRLLKTPVRSVWKPCNLEFEEVEASWSPFPLSMKKKSSDCFVLFCVCIKCSNPFV